MAISLFGSNIYSQKLYVVNFSTGSCINECAALESYYFLSNNIVVEPIGGYDGFLIFDKPPTFVELITVADTGFGCAWRDPMACYQRSAINMNDCYWGISNEVLTPPTATTNGFCDKISLAAVGCTGNQRFFWEYSTDGVNYTKINVTTKFNQNYEFVKANFPALNNYFGNIFFRVLIDSDPNFTEENIYSNIVNYSIIPCSPDLSNTSSPNYTTCNYSNGEVIFTFSRPIATGEKYLFNRNIVGSTFVTSASSNDDDVEKISPTTFKWKNIPPGDYQFKYQAQFENNKPGSVSLISSFTILPREQLTFKATAVQPLCSSDKGAIIISVTGGTSPYYYILDNETKKLLIKNPDTIPLSTDGVHKVIVMDSKECIEK